jgi:hypothetical protein
MININIQAIKYKCFNQLTLLETIHWIPSLVTYKGEFKLDQDWHHFMHSSFVSIEEPKDIDKALRDPDWENALHEELNNFKRNEV